MRTSWFSRYSFSCAAFVFLAGCSGSQPQVGAPSAMPQTPPIAKRTSSTYRVLYRFGRESPGGYYPTASLIAVNGTLYGTTMLGGNESCDTYGCGTVYSVSTSGVEHVLHAFMGGSDGGYPQAALIDVKGTLYGTTPGGGSSHDGVVFSISTSGAEHVLYSFTGGSDGSFPLASLIYANGLLYGTTAEGGESTCTYSNGCGTVFSISTSGKETVIYRKRCMG